MLRYIGSVDDKYIEELFTDSINTARTERRRPKWGLIAASLALVILGSVAVFGGHAPENSGVADVKPEPVPPVIAVKNSIVMLDVNPSISIEVNEAGEVVSVSAENEDADTLLGELKLEGKNYEEAVKISVSVLQTHEYITPLKNSVLITVLGDNEEIANEIRSNSVKAIVDGDSDEYELSVLSQIMTDDSKYKEEASQYNVSTGRMWLIEKTSVINDGFSVDNIAEQTIHTLNQLYTYTGLPELVERVGNAAGTVPDEYIEKMGVSELSGDDLISFVKDVSEFYDDWSTKSDTKDADRQIGNAFNSASSGTDEAREICHLVVDCLKVLEQNSNSNGGSNGSGSGSAGGGTQNGSNDKKITADDIGKLADAIISIVEYFD